MSDHTMEVVFKGTTFDECYFTLDGQKCIRLTRCKDGTYRGFWENVDLMDIHGQESVRFSLAARGVQGDRCSLEILVDGKTLRKYSAKDRFRYEQNGWVSKVDIVYLTKD